MPCPECPETPDTGCLHPITTECVTYNGNDIDCANISSGQSLNQVIEQLANNDCDLQEQIEDIVQDIEELSGNVTDIKNQINNINSFSCEDLSGCTLDELGDVDVTHVSGDILMSNGTKWINYTPEEIVPYQFTCEELSGCTLDSLSGVSLDSPTSGDVLIHDGNNFINYSFADLFTADNGLTKNNTNIQLGGELTQNTTIDGDKELNLLIRVLRLIQYDENSTYYNLLEVQNKKKYNNTSDFANFNVAISGNKKSIIDGVFNLSTIGTALEANSLSHDIEFINNTSSLDKSGVSAIGYGDVCNLSMGFGAQSTEAGHIDSMRNLTLSPIFKGNNSTPFTVDKYVSIAIMDLTQSFGTPSDWVIPTDRYAILQEGASDKNVFYGEIEYHGALTNASDLRSKNKGEAFTKGLDIIEQVNPVNFTKKEGFGATDVNHVGIIAQELEQILPEAIKIGKCQDIEDFRFYDQSVLLYTLLNAVKELSIKVKQLENGIQS